MFTEEQLKELESSLRTVLAGSTGFASVIFYGALVEVEVCREGWFVRVTAPSGKKDQVEELVSSILA